MGYGMTQVSARFHIKKENHTKALEAIKSMAGKETCDISSHYPAHFSWVRSNFVSSSCLEEALNCWRWDPDLDSDGNIIDLNFNGEKYGDDNSLFKTIAPFVEDGSEIEMRGEDGGYWKWMFDGNTCKEVQGKVVYKL